MNKYELKKLISTEDFNFKNIMIKFCCQIMNSKHIKNKNIKYKFITYTT